MIRGDIVQNEECRVGRYEPLHYMGLYLVKYEGALYSMVKDGMDNPPKLILEAGLEAVIWWYLV